MSIQQILHYPDPRLRKIAARVDVFDNSLHTLVEDMFETMYDASGIGLAATQIDIHRRVIVVDITCDKSSPLHLINPIIKEKFGLVESKEGCLSVPQMIDYVDRAERVVVAAVRSDGSAFAVETEGLLAICIQHEIDHLDGKLFIDYLSSLKQSRLRKKLHKENGQQVY